MHGLDLALRLATVRSVLATQGVPAALATLNQKTEYRFTGLYKLRGAGMCAAFVFDRAAELRARQRLAPLRTSIWRHMLHEGQFMTSSASQDDQLSHCDMEGFLESCCASLLQPKTCDLPCGVLIHFDVTQRSIDEAEAMMLRRAGPLFLAYLARGE